MKSLLGTAFGLILMFGTLLAADVSGKWNFVLDTPVGELESVVTLEVKGDKVTGKMELGETDIKGTFADGKLATAFPFYSGEAGYEAELKFTGTLDGDKITGNWEFDVYSGTFVATRAK